MASSDNNATLPRGSDRPVPSVLFRLPESSFPYGGFEGGTLLVQPRPPSEAGTNITDIMGNTPTSLEDIDKSLEGTDIEWLNTSASSSLRSTVPQFSVLKQNANKPPQSHWFYCKLVERKKVWFPFSLLDSLHLEEEFLKGCEDDQHIVATDGGRYDVYLQTRVRCAIYWEEESSTVRRATWFYRREGERSFVPYPEHFAEKLEEEYSIALNTNTWHRRLEFPKGETVVFHNPSVIVHYQTSSTGRWEGSPEGLVKPSVVKRGMDDYEQVEDGEAMQIDHLVFVVHGIGAICDLKFRTLPEVVNDFRSISGALLKTHFKPQVSEGKIGRVEFLPASWHTFLHGEATGIDEKLKPITLKSIPKLRYFANDAILDVLFYTSPFYCQAIINQVGSEINRLYNLFISRNPSFQGNVSLAGHSLGSVILFDILLHQEDSLEKKGKDSTMEAPHSSMAAWSSTDSSKKQVAKSEMESNPEKYSCRKPTVEDVLHKLGLNEYHPVFEKNKIDFDTLTMCDESDMKNMGIPSEPSKRLLAFLKTLKESADILTEIPMMKTLTESGTVPKRKQSETTINYIVGLAGTGHPYVIYPRINFKPTCFFALGSPIAMFLTVRGLDTDWKGFQFPSCPAFFNIFHPYDPVAYRIEPLVDPSIDLKPVLIPHHKGRKRMHLEIKESLSRVGNDLKQKVYDSLLFSWNTINDFARTRRASTAAEHVENEMPNTDEQESKSTNNAMDRDSESTFNVHELCEEDAEIGNLNGGRRIDYVLQEKPLESFNEYLFALGSHTCYWESEDTVLLILKEIYGNYGFAPSFQFSELQGTGAGTGPAT